MALSVHRGFLVSGVSFRTVLGQKHDFLSASACRIWHCLTGCLAPPKRALACCFRAMLGGAMIAPRNACFEPSPLWDSLKLATGVFLKGPLPRQRGTPHCLSSFTLTGLADPGRFKQIGQLVGGVAPSAQRLYPTTLTAALGNQCRWQNQQVGPDIKRAATIGFEPRMNLAVSSAMEPSLSRLRTPLIVSRSHVPRQLPKKCSSVGRRLACRTGT